MTLTEFYAAVGGSYEDASARLQNDAFIGRVPADAAPRRQHGPPDGGRGQRQRRGSLPRRPYPEGHRPEPLSLVRLAEACAAMTEALRGSAVMPDNVRALHDAVAREYALVTETLSQLEA